MSTVKSVSSGFDSRSYRDTLGCFATGVCLISVLDSDGKARAITANSFSSISLTPPIILWAVDIHSDRCALFCDAPYFSVSFLTSDQEAYAKTFAKDPQAVLEHDDLVSGQHRIPRFSGALGYLECETGWRQKAGDHIVIFGNVIGYGSKSGDALGFFKGKFTGVSEG